MPQNDTKTSTTVSAPSAATVENPTRTTAAPVQEPVATPPQFSSVGNVINNPTNDASKEGTRDGADQVTTDQVNASVGQQKAPEEKPAKKGPMNIEELQEKRRMGLLTIDEARQLNEAEKADADATVKQLPDNDREIKDPDKNSFKQDDVINYMYEKWLIDGVMWLDQKARKYGAYGFERLLSAVRQGREERKAEAARIQNSSTFKSAEKIAAKRRENEEKIKEQSNQRANDIFRISQVIQAGTLFDPANKELLAKFDEINKSNTPEGQERRQQLEQSSQKLKENPESREQQQEMKKQAAVFSCEAHINNRFDTKCQLAANDVTAANMLDTITREKDPYPKGVETAYDSQMETNTNILNDATQDKRKKALADENLLSKNNEQQAKYEARMQMGAYGTQIVKETRNWEKEVFGNLEELHNLAEKSMDKSMGDVTSGYVVEFDKEPKENKSLNKMNNFVADRLPDDYEPSKAKAAEENVTPPPVPKQEEDKEKAESKEKTEPRETGHNYTKEGVKEYAETPAPTTTVTPTSPAPENNKAETVRDEAQTQQARDATLTAKKTNMSDREADLANREQQHEERGQRLRNSPLYARLYNRQAAQTIQKGKETGFKDWKLDIAALKQQKGTYE